MNDRNKRSNRLIAAGFDPENDDSIQLAGECDNVTGSTIIVGLGDDLSVEDIIEGLAQITVSALLEALRAKDSDAPEGLMVIALAGKLGSVYGGIREHEKKEAATALGKKGEH